MIFVKDDFLSEPFELKRYLKDKKRNWYSDNSFSWPGERCYEIPEEIKNKILNTAISITQDKTLSLDQINCHKISSKDTHIGWTHYDEEYKYAAVLYLSLEIDRNSGTELYNYYWETDYLNKVKEFRRVRKLFLKSGYKNFITRILYKLSCNKFNNFFNKKDIITIGYKFNRFVLYEAKRLHRPKKILSSKEDGFRTNIVAFFK